MENSAKTGLTVHGNHDQVEPIEESLIKKSLPLYKVVKELGSGNFGAVYHVKDNYKERAVKVVRLKAVRTRNYAGSTALRGKIDADFRAVQKYYHQFKGPGVVEIHDFHFVETRVSDAGAEGYLIILMEKCPHNLGAYVLDNKLPSQNIVSRMQELAGVLDRLSSGVNPFLVTDLKPANLLLTDQDKLVIGDLGGVKRLGSISAGSKGQLDYDWTAPEVMRGEEPSVASVIFGYGLVSFFMWEGELPFGDEIEAQKRLAELRNCGGLPAYQHSSPPEFIQALIQTCLADDPANRPDGFGTILRLLSHLQAIPKALPSWEVVEMLGQGIFGAVYHVKDTSSSRAVKVVRLRANLKDRIISDFKVLDDNYQKIKWLNVVAIYGFYFVETVVGNTGAEGFLVILMKKYPHNLRTYVLNNMLRSEMIVSRMKELANVLECLSRGEHPFRVTDLKPENLLLTDQDTLVIGDPGVKHLASISAESTEPPDLSWAAPEVVQGRPASVQSVIFEYGLVCFFMWEQELPFGDKLSPEERLKNLREKELVFRSRPPVSVRALIQTCLADDPAQRPKDFSGILKLMETKASNEKRATGTFDAFKGRG